MPEEGKAPAPVDRRVAALEQAFEERNLIPAGFIDDFAQSEDERTYEVSFRTEDLWPQAADRATVHVGVFESYLEPAL